ncbi:MAG: chemotaxis protein CheX, partial [Campylobacterales bacterium]
MRAVLKNGIAVFHPQGFLDGNSAETMLSIEDIKTTEKLETDLVLVSLKKVIFFNKNGLETFVKMLTKVRKSTQARIGFCDYDTKKFNSIINFFKDDLSFSLFNTIDTASLFASNFKNQKKNALVYSENKSQRSVMAIELHNYGHNPIIAQSKEEFEEKKKNAKTYDVIIENSYMGCMENGNIAARVSSNAIIYNISSFLDASISNNFNIYYHNNSLKAGFRLFIFEAYQVINMNVHAVNFFSKLASAAAEYNATICFVGLSKDKITQKFYETLEDSGIMFFEQLDTILDDKKLLAELGASTATNIKDKRSLNKAMITQLPSFIDATVDTIKMMTNAEAKKESASIYTIKIQEVEDKIASSIGFYGDIDGMVILVFPKNIAKKACELLIGEETDDKELIMDALGEFVNIIGGKIKSLLEDNDIRVKITLPRTYNEVSELLTVADNRKGVQVDLTFDGDKFS